MLVGVEKRSSAINLEDRLESLLSESVDSAIRRERRAFDELTSPFEKRLVLFGAGGMGRRTLAGLRKIGIEPLAFADNNPTIWGTTIEGVPVISPDTAAVRFRREAAFVVTVWGSTARDHMRDRMSQLRSLGCCRVAPAGYLFWKHPEAFLPAFHLDLPHKALEQADDVRKAFYLWEDEVSRREYVAQFEFRSLLAFETMMEPDHGNHYFAPGIYRLRPGEVFVDCGAFDGDTVQSFLERGAGDFQRIIAFEPDPLNWIKLEGAIKQLPDHVRSKIRCLQRALAFRTAESSFNASGTDQAALGHGDTIVRTVTLDESLKDEAPTIVKFDIEGAELDALAGARELIKREMPVLAISAYHQQDHLWKVPLLVNSITEEYKFFLRPHGSEGWDLVCYAVPPERSLLT